MLTRRLRAAGPSTPPLARRLHQVGDAAVPQHLDPIERDGRPRKGAHEPLATDIGAGRDTHRAVDVEAVALRREGSLSPIERRVPGVLGLVLSRTLLHRVPLYLAVAFPLSGAEIVHLSTVLLAVGAWRWRRRSRVRGAST